MSGIFSRTQYDDCYHDEYQKINKPQINHALFLNYHVNPNMKANMNVCVHNKIEKDNCFICNLNSSATLDKTPDNFPKITDIDSNLKGIDRQLSYCNDKKFQGCFNDNKSAECTNNVIVNPQLCEREVAPTNMKRFENILF
jgi:hypothetical protein